LEETETDLFVNALIIQDPERLAIEDDPFAIILLLSHRVCHYAQVLEMLQGT